MMINIPEEITKFIEDIDFQINTQKDLFQNAVMNNQLPSPMVIHYKNPNSPYLTIASPVSEIFEDTIMHISTALHLYPIIPSVACYVTLSSNYVIDEVSFPALNMFVMFHSNAYTFTFPYSKNENQFEWLDNHVYISQVDDQTLDDVGKGILTSFYLFVNSSGLPFTAKEVLSYMSTTGHAFVFNEESDSIKYLNFSNLS